MCFTSGGGIGRGGEGGTSILLGVAASYKLVWLLGRFALYDLMTCCGV